MTTQAPFHDIPTEERDRIQRAFNTFAQWDILTALSESSSSVMSAVMLAHYTARRFAHIEQALDTLVGCGAVEMLVDEKEQVLYRLTRDEATRQLILHILAACTDWAFRKRLVQWIFYHQATSGVQETVSGESS
ncbi:hypothetical protein ARMA_0406 [Ardenticatena maritima]|uniref:HTH arsR-type domain-containing protein n=2 Tax=Ardenticatena maritima TaxID=872965 RepID=A0A0M8K5A4_9CHLR|nr:hypothetical protein [Ardenticatena maritima]GAP61983.1 hypothetical protein ARMA_0406 [Ardenticatena maritima]